MSTTTDLINSIKMRGSFPTADDLFSNADYLSILNDEMMNQVVPLIVKVNEEYFETYQDTTTVVGQEAYRIPKRAIASQLRDVQLIDSAGSVTSLPRLFEEDKYNTSQGPLGYYIKSNQVILSPKPTSTAYTLRLAYFRRLSTFVLPAACAQITAIVGTTITVSALPTTMTTGTVIDFVQGATPYDLLQMDSAIASASGTTLTFTTVPTDLAVGDYINLAGQTCVPMIPEEIVPFLVQSALVICLSSKKDNAAALEIDKLQSMSVSLLSLLSPRVKSDDVKIKSNNSLLNTFRGY